MTDHSPNLTVANGLSTERLMRQLDEIEERQPVFATEAEAGAQRLRVLSGIEVDINEDGTRSDPQRARGTRHRRRERAPNCVHPAT